MGVRDLPQDYSSAAYFLNRKDNGKGKVNHATVANNTTINRLPVEGGKAVFTLELHGHPIVAWFHDGRIVLDSCGWRTSTTKDRLNNAQKLVVVSQRKGQWYVNRVTPGVPLDNANEEPFFDGITFEDHGQAIAAHYDRTGDPNGPTGGYTGD